MSQRGGLTTGEIFDLLRMGKINEGIALLYKYHYNKMYGIAFSILQKGGCKSGRST